MTTLDRARHISGVLPPSASSSASEPSSSPSLSSSPHLPRRDWCRWSHPVRPRAGPDSGDCQGQSVPVVSQQQHGVVLRVLLRGQDQAGCLGAVLFTPVFTGSAPSFSFRYIGECLDILSPLCLTPQQCKMNFNFSLQIRPLGCTDFL